MGMIYTQDTDRKNQTPVSATNPLPTTTAGAAADGAAATANPIPVGGKFNTTRPTYDNGDQTVLQADSRGNIAVALYTGGTPAGIAAATVVTLVSAATVGLDTRAYQYKADGTGWRADSRPASSSLLPSAAASVNATIVKAAAGDLHRLSGYNAAASVRYLKFYNKATEPSEADTPILIYALQPTSDFAIDAGGFYCSAGISYRMTTGAANNDTGALTLADIVALTVTYA
ncbi:hypothetical protein [Brevundimonas sp.]|uniref:hypothetical protein n=1 Tax=Brevundimonas sp. TaxID=1871086 RepID=UPI002D3AC814|nr:hypothetical protein [Brevundimonas sp.]HYC98492.1 hypothetical protein [Brevundimonas sp.]